MQTMGLFRHGRARSDVEERREEKHSYVGEWAVRLEQICCQTDWALAGTDRIRRDESWAEAGPLKTEILQISDAIADRPSLHRTPHRPLFCLQKHLSSRYMYPPSLACDRLGC
jgi:hypothetical protein